jgi:hypothetical protein
MKKKTKSSKPISPEGADVFYKIVAYSAEHGKYVSIFDGRSS